MELLTSSHYASLCRGWSPIRSGGGFRGGCLGCRRRSRFLYADVVVIFQIPTIIANIRIPYQEITQGDTVVIGNLLATLILDDFMETGISRRHAFLSWCWGDDSGGGWRGG